MITYRTSGGVDVTRSDAPLEGDGIEDIITAVETRRGGVFSSGMEYPGRYSRWHMAYVNPCLEVVARGRDIAVTALNQRGHVLLPTFGAALDRAGEERPAGPDTRAVRVAQSHERFTEEERSRRPSVFTALRQLWEVLQCDDPHLGFYGAFGYDLAFQFEPVEPVTPRAHDQRDLVLQLPDDISVWDRKREIAHRFRYEFSVDGSSTQDLPRTTVAEPYQAASSVPAGPTPGQYAQTVRTAKQEFAAGNLFEVVPGQSMYATCDSPARFFRTLRESNPAPYEFFVNLGEREYLVGASPEMYVRVNGDRVETCPISGTIGRGSDALEDARNIATLLASSKEESELTMCTDVDRNDKARVCQPGSVQVIGRRQIEMYSRVIHTVDHVEGRLRPGMDALDAFLTHMWAVTVTGAPKTWAMRFIEQHEATPRRWYAGAVGKLGVDGSMNTGLALRTAQIADGVVTVRAGATLLWDSDPDAEERETHLKARALLDALNPKPRAESPSQEVETPGEGMRVLLVDHEDSFVHTLGDYFRQHGAHVETVRFGFDAALLDETRPDLVVLSPGPGVPADFGCARLLEALEQRQLPAFGVCLGLQAMVEYTGGSLSRLAVPWHGKPATVKPSGGKLLDGLSEFTAARYHSLYTTTSEVHGFDVTASTDDVVMAIESAQRGWFGVQFHPESILTAHQDTGLRILGNLLRQVR